MTPRGALRSLSAACGEEVSRILATRLDLLLLTLMPLVLLGSMAAMLWGGSPHDLRTVIVDRDGGSVARAIVRNIAANRALQIVGTTPSLDDAMAMIRREAAVAAVVIPRGVGTRNARGAPVEIFYQTVFLSTGALASTSLRVVISTTLADRQLRDAALGGVAALHTPLPGVQVTLLGNPTASLEWYLGLLLGPAILHLLIAVTCVGSVGLLLDDKAFAAFARRSPHPAATLIGRLTPHVAAGTMWTTVWLLWLTLARGYRAEGSLALIVAGALLLFVATAAVALLLLAATREVSTALSGAVIIAGSALAYSGTSLPITGAGLFPRIWSDLLPLTHFLTLQMDQVLGVSAAPVARAVSGLLLYPLVAGGIALRLIVRAGRRA